LGAGLAGRGERSGIRIKTRKGELD
jgi:hypothetical protein